MKSSSKPPASKVVRLRDFGTRLLFRDRGIEIRGEIERLLETHTPILVDLDGLEATSPSFVDECLGILLDHIGKDRFKSSIQLNCENEAMRRLVNRVLNNRLAIQAQNVERERAPQ